MESQTQSSKQETVTQGHIDLVKQYFGKEISANFTYVNDGYLQITNNINTRGFVFTGPFQCDRDHEQRMLKRMNRDRADGKTIDAYFVNNLPEVQISGYEWRAN